MRTLIWLTLLLSLAAGLTGCDAVASAVMQATGTALVAL